MSDDGFANAKPKLLHATIKGNHQEQAYFQQVG
jgi:hypothetical protein